MSKSDKIAAEETHQQNVGRRAAVGGAWMIGARLLSRSFDLISMLVLARILRPNDFGLVAIAMTVILVLEAVLELPVSQALVRLENLAEDHYNTAFTLSVLRGLLLSSAICLISVPFAHFYVDSRLAFICCVLSIAPCARGLASPRLADFAKRLDFSRDFLTEMLGKGAALMIAVWVALQFHTYWAIVLGTVTSPTVASIASYVVAPYRPKFSLKSMPYFSRFLGWITLSQVISAINWQADRFLLGKLTSRSEMGLFTASNDLSNIPLLTLFGPVLRPLHSAFSQLKNDAEQLRSSYQRSAAAMVTIALPLLLSQSILALPLVRLLFGEQWIGAAPMLRLLALSLIPSAFAVPLGPLVMSLDRTSIFVKRNALELCIKLPLVVLGTLYFRFYGVIGARIISEVVTIAYCLIQVRSLIGLSLVTQFLKPWKAYLASAAMSAVLYVCLPFVTDHAILALAIHTGLVLSAGYLVYVAILLMLWRWEGQLPGIESMAVNTVASLFRQFNAIRGRSASQRVGWDRSVTTAFSGETAND